MGFRDIDPGKIWKQEIIRALDQAGAFALVLSRHSAVSEDVGIELQQARQRKLPILMFLIDDRHQVRAMDYDLTVRQYIDAGPNPTIKQFAVLANEITRNMQEIAPADFVPIEVPSSPKQVPRSKLTWALLVAPLPLAAALWLTLNGVGSTPAAIDRKEILKQLEMRANEDTAPLAKATPQQKEAHLKDLRKVIADANRQEFYAYAHYWSALDMFWQYADIKAPQKMTPQALLMASSRLGTAWAVARQDKNAKLGAQIRSVAIAFRARCDSLQNTEGANAKIWTPALKKQIHEHLDPIAAGVIS